MKRAGSADLPLHSGRVPVWLAERMTKLGTAMVEAIISEYGRDEFLSRISDPFWFQAFGSVMGMDWHSSGITTSVIGALKRGINPRSHDLGMLIAGGRGKYSRQTPEELTDYALNTGLDGNALVRASKLSAKVDNACVQDGFSVYLHSFFVTRDGKWAVVQQGMNKDTSMARRYHWHSESIRSFVSDPQAAIVGENKGDIVNLSDSQALPARKSILDFMSEHPERQISGIEQLAESGHLSEKLLGQLIPSRQLTLPSHHEVFDSNVSAPKLGGVLAMASERRYRDFAEALLLEGLGPRTLHALALVSETMYGTPVRFEDPARFSFAFGGKDGHPFPVLLDVYDNALEILRRALDKAALGNSEKLDGIKKISYLSRVIEKLDEPDADIQALIQRERLLAPYYGGRSVMNNPEKKPRDAIISKTKNNQLELF